MPSPTSHRSPLASILLAVYVMVGLVAAGTEGEPSSFDAPLPSAEPGSEPNDDAPAPSGSKKRPHITLDEMARGLDRTGTPSLPRREGELPPPSTEPGVEPPLPEYDGRDAEPANAADVLIWVPRVLFYPAHLIMQWGVRWPLVTLITLSEKYAVTERIHDLLTWDEGRAGIFPRFLLDFGVRPHAGLSFFWNELFGSTDVAASVSAWGDDLIAARLGANTRVFRNDSAVFSVHGSYVRRPDNPYYGRNDGNDPCNLYGCRYRSAIGEADIGLIAMLEELNRVSATLTFRDAQFSIDSDAPSLSPTYAIALPGFHSGYRLLEAQVIAEIDSRSANVEFEHGSGVRLELMGSFAFDPSYPDLRFFRYGGEAAGFWDFGNRHVLAGRLYMELMGNVSKRIIPDRRGRKPIPFTELITVGGAERMRGFLEGRLRGHRAWVATLEYRWPIHGFFDATAFASLGNAFRSFEDFDIVRNYLNYGLGFRTNTSREVVFEILVALGTNRLDSSSIDPIHAGRLVLGINHGF